MTRMSEAYDQLLDATIQHLQDLKARGVRFISTSPETLSRLTQPPFRVSTSTPPAPARPALAKPAPKPAAQPTKPAASTPAHEQSLALGLPGETAPAIPRQQLSPEAKAAAFADLRQRALA